MNALELCMYARGMEPDSQPQLVLIGEVAERERPLFAEAAVPSILESIGLANEVIDRVRRVAAAQPRRRKPRTISG